ncbi:MAG TPA: hypothetical protein VGK67_03850, partial [Myxococcales bacterium]
PPRGRGFPTFGDRPGHFTKTPNPENGRLSLGIRAENTRVGLRGSQHQRQHHRSQRHIDLW